MKNLSFEKKDNGVAVVTIDCPDSRVNKVSSGLLAEIAGLLDEVGRDGTIRGMVIHERQGRQLRGGCGRGRAQRHEGQG